MSGNMGQPVHNPNAFTTPIAEMGAWDFWSRTDGIGLPAEIEQSLLDGTPTPEQLDHVRAVALFAKNALIAAPAYVPFVRPS